MDAMTEMPEITEYEAEVPEITEYDVLTARMQELDAKVQQILDVMQSLQVALGQASKHPMLSALFGGMGR